MKEIIKLLKYTAREDDKTSFKEYMRKEISLKELKRRIFKHNEIPEDVSFMITDYEFKNWIISLGWVL